MYKYYGGIDRFNNISLVNKCILHAIKKEAEIPKLIKELIQKFNTFANDFESTSNKKMRSAEEILKDYGMRGE